MTAEALELRVLGPVTALKLQKSCVWIAQGPEVISQDWESGAQLGRSKVFDKHRIHGIQATANLLLAWGDRSLVVFEISKPGILGHSRFSIKFGDWVTFAQISNSLNSFLVLTSHGVVFEFELGTCKLKNEIVLGAKSLLYSGTISESENSILIGCGTVMHGALVYKYPCGELVCQVNDHNGSIFDLALSRGHQSLATCSDDRAIIVTNIATKKVIKGWGHTSRIWKLKFTESADELLSVSEDLSLRSWKFAESSLECTRVLGGHSGRNIWSVDYLSEENRKVVVTGGADGRVLLHSLTEAESVELATQQSLHSELGEGNALTSLGHLNSKLFATSKHGNLYEYVENAWKMIANDVSAQSQLHRAGQSLVYAGKEGELKLIDSSGLITTIEIPLRNKLHIVADESFVVIQSQSCPETVLVNLATKTCFLLPIFAKDFSITAFALHNNLFIAGSRRGMVAAFNFKATEPQFIKITPKQDSITSLLFCKDNVIGFTVRNGQFGYLTVAPDGQISLLSESNLQHGVIDGSQLQNDNTIVAWGFRKDLFFVHNLTLDLEIKTIVCGGARRLWTSDICKANALRSRLTWLKHGSLEQYDSFARSSVVAKQLLIEGSHGREIRGAEINILGGLTFIATASEDTCVKLFIYGNNCLQLQTSMRAHVSGVQALHWSSDGRFLVSSGGREELLVWKFQQLAQTGYLKKVCALPFTSTNNDVRIMDFDMVAFGSNYLLSVVYSDGRISLWRFDGSEFRLGSIIEERKCCLLQTKLAILDDNVIVLTAGTDGQLDFWKFTTDLTTCQSKLHVRLHQNSIRTLDIAVIDNRVLTATGGDDCAISAGEFSQGKYTSSFENKTAHASTVTAIKIKNTELYTVSADQNLKHWTLSGNLIESHRTFICDTDCLDVKDDLIVAAGSGIVVFEQSSSEAESPSKRLRIF